MTQNLQPNQPTQQRVCVAGLLIHDKQALLLRRSEQETFLPGIYDLPGGKLELGEDLAVGLRREFFEETGLTIEVKQLYAAWSWCSLYKGQLTQFFNLSYLVKTEFPAEIQLAREFSDYRWTTLPDLDTLPMTGELRTDVAAGIKFQGSLTSEEPLTP